MSVTIDGPADFPALYRSADRESVREAKQHPNLATAYGIASQELASIATELATLPGEERWAAFVGQAEEAISREHTLWRASRGLRG